MAVIETSVLIVGGGGAGLTASMLLSKLGVDSYLVSSLPTTSLLQLVGTDHVLFGSDYPYAPEAITTASVALLDRSPLLTATDRDQIYSRTAADLFPRFG